MALHYVTGDLVKINGASVKGTNGETLFDTSFEGLAKIYNMTSKAIAAANGFPWNSAAIYAWLKANGGIETTKGVWSLSSGMVVEIPVSQDRIVSPVPMDKKDEVKPAGPATPPVGGTGTATQAAVGMDSMTMILIAGAAIGLLIMMKTGGKKGRKTSKRRKTARRTTRRRR